MSSRTDARPPGPSGAERVRSVLTAARSLTVTTDGYRCDLVGAHALDDRGRLTLRLPGDCHLAAAVACAPRGDLAAMLQFTDVAPTAVRDRVRARVTLSGWLTDAGADDAVSGGAVGVRGTKGTRARGIGGDRARGAGGAGDAGDAGDHVGLRLDTVRATLDTGAGPEGVGLDELVLAGADPLAGHEAALLIHLTDGHPDAVARLARLVEPRHLHGVRRVVPVALDRYGITLRLERARAHDDVRLPFAVPLRDAAEFGDRVQALLAAARACPRRRSLHTRP
ncbi:DUF2470 domain-containing protein [Streptomyces lavendofoliae]|uniref:DUF2470 domain-containing protein n=1 Tax=Streptomyces lavendofoliae TaxID=67314 RepID=A0A918HWA8_9ACTN|nr:DUF2470 domain-containing protein [Streptomyces lavendofoliae]GGU28838.1 hypothetical protein GCM10010274_14540 [Streptomyces lavendofoliae]